MNFPSTGFIASNQIPLTQLFLENSANSGCHVFRNYFKGDKIITFAEYAHLRYLELHQGVVLTKKNELRYYDHSGFCVSFNGQTYYSFHITQLNVRINNRRYENKCFNSHGIKYINPVIIMDTFSFFNYHTIINDVNYAVSSILDNDVRHMVHSSSDAFRAAFERTKALNKAKGPSIYGNWGVLEDYISNELFKLENQKRMIRVLAEGVFWDDIKGRQSPRRILF